MTRLYRSAQLLRHVLNKAFPIVLGCILGVSTSAYGDALKLNGVVFVQAAEQGSFHCFNANSLQAIDCALQACEAEVGNDCFVTTWCWPEQMSGKLLVLGDDLQFQIPLCG